MSSELGAVTSGYDKQGASLKGLTAKSNILNKQIEQQKIKQEALNGAVKDAQSIYDKAAQKAAEMAKEHGENSKEAQKAADAVNKAEKNLKEYEIKANNAEKALNKMESAQKEVSKEKFEKITEGLKNIAKIAGNVAKETAKIAGKTLEAGLNGTAKAFTAYAAGAAGAGTAAFALSAKAGAAADDLNTMAKVTGLSTEQLQKMQYASTLVDVDVDTVTGSLSKLTKNMYSAQQGGKGTSEAFAALGISITDSNGELKNNEVVFNEAINALGKIENGTQRDALAMQIFGKSAQELNPLIMGGADQLKQLGDSAQNAGLIISQNGLDSLNEFNDSLDILKANGAAAGNVIGGTFAGSFKGVTDIIGGELPKITQSFTDLFGVGDMEQKQADFTARLTNFGNKIIEKIGAELPKLLSGFNTVIISIVTAIGELLPQAISTILPPLITGFNNLISGLIEQIPVILPALIDGGIMLFMGLLDSLESIVNQLLPMLPGIIAQICDALIQNLPAIIETGCNVLVGLIKGIADTIPVLITKITELIPVIIQAITDNLPALLEAGIQIIVTLAKGLPEAIPAIIKAIPEVIKAILDALFEVDWLDVGAQILKGIADGLIAGLTAINDTIANVANGILNGFKNFFGIHSPSRVFKDQVGKYLAQGIGLGFTDEMSKVSADMKKAVPDNFDIVANGNVRATNSTASSGGVTQYNNYYAARALTRTEKYRMTRGAGQLAGAIV